MTKQNEKDAKRVPELRFKGFTDDWEQRKLGDITRRYDNLRVPVTASKRKHGDIPYYGANGIQDFVSGYTHDGEFILVAEDGARDPKNYPVNYVNGKIWVNNHAHVLQGIQGLANNLFLLNGIKKINIVAYLVGGSRAKLNAETLMQLSIKLPSIHEQEKIGQLFQSLDKTITLHEEQHRQLEQLKKALLQKMFADETGYPALRFKGFTEKWEQRKLGETVVNIVAGGDINKAELLSKGKYPVYANALTNNGIVGYYASQYRIAAPAVTVTGRGDIGIAKARDINFTPVVRLLAISSQHNNYFLENLINTHRSFAESTGVPQLTVPQLSNYKLYFPQKINEEVFIGKLFKKMDHLTTLHQHKIDNLKRLKRALLQKMFV